MFASLLQRMSDMLEHIALTISFSTMQSGAVAVLFRQTNIIWVLFVAGTIIVRCVEFSHGSFIYG